MVQELLNRSRRPPVGASLSNGRELRLLRDSDEPRPAQAYVEFDLEAIFDGELFTDFVLLYLLCPPVPGRGPRRRRPAQRLLAGTLAHHRHRARHPRAHPAARRRRRPRSRPSAPDSCATRPTPSCASSSTAGALAPRRLPPAAAAARLPAAVLFVAEDRDALLAPDADADGRGSATPTYFSTARLRRLALRRRGTTHGDLWLAPVARSRRPRPRGRASPSSACPASAASSTPTAADVLAGCPAGQRRSARRGPARCASSQPKGQPRRTVDYRNLGAEELGSVYESLLELVPRHDPVDQTFTLDTARRQRAQDHRLLLHPHRAHRPPPRHRARPAPRRGRDARRDPEAAPARRHRLRPGLRLRALPRRRRPPDRQPPRRRPHRRDRPHPRRRPGRPARRRRPLHLRRRRQPDGRRARQGQPLAGSPRTRPAARLPRRATSRSATRCSAPRPRCSPTASPTPRSRRSTGDDKPTVDCLAQAQRSRSAPGRTTCSTTPASTSATRRSRRRVTERSPTRAAGAAPSPTSPGPPSATRPAGRPRPPAARRVADAWCAAFVWPKTPRQPRRSPRPTLEEHRRRHRRPRPSSTVSRRISRPVPVLPLAPRVPGHLPGPGRRPRRTRATGWTAASPRRRQPAVGAGQAPGAGVLRQPATRASPAPRTPRPRKKLIAALAVTNPALLLGVSHSSAIGGGEPLPAHVSGRYPLTGHGDINTYSVFAEHIRSSSRRTGGAAASSRRPAWPPTQRRRRSSPTRSRRAAGRVLRLRERGEDLRWRSPPLPLRVSTVMTGRVQKALTSRSPSSSPRRRRAAPAVRARGRRGAVAQPEHRHAADVPHPRRRGHHAGRLPTATRSSIQDEVDGGNPWGPRVQRDLFNMANDSGLFRGSEDGASRRRGR